MTRQVIFSLMRLAYYMQHLLLRVNLVFLSLLLIMHHKLRKDVGAVVYRSIEVCRYSRARPWQSLLAIQNLDTAGLVMIIDMTLYSTKRDGLIYKVFALAAISSKTY